MNLAPREKGKLLIAMAAIVARRRPERGVKPDLAIKGGVIAAAPMGDLNASIPTPQRVHSARCSGRMGGRGRDRR